MINFEPDRYAQSPVIQVIPLFRVRAALVRRNQRAGHPQHLAAVLHMVEELGICPKTVAMPRDVTYDGYGRIFGHATMYERGVRA